MSVRDGAPSHPGSGDRFLSESGDGAGARGRAALLAITLLPSAGAVHAAQWSVEPRVRVAQSYTDNVALAASNEQSDHVTELSPGIRLTGEGRRADLELAYRANSLYYHEESDRNETFHEAVAEGGTELIRRHLFLDADVARVEDVTAADETVPASDVFAAGRRDDVTTWGVAPRFLYGLGSFARFQARFRREGLEADERVDTITDSGSVRLSSGPRFNAWGWALSYEHRQEDEERADDTDAQEEDRTFATARGEINVRAGARTVLFAAGGREANEFETAPGEAIDGDFWDAGLRWSSRTVSMEASVGERFFGDTASVRLDAQGAALGINVSYAESLTTRSQIVSERTTFLVRDEDGDPVLGPGGDPLTVAVATPSIQEEVILQERARIGLDWERGHSRVALDLTWTNREFLESGDTETSDGLNLGYEWTRLARTTLELGLGYRQREFALTDTEDEFATARVGARRALADELNVSLDVEHSERDSTDAGRDYEVNRITVALEKVF